MAPHEVRNRDIQARLNKGSLAAFGQSEHSCEQRAVANLALHCVIFVPPPLLSGFRRQHQFQFFSFPLRFLLGRNDSGLACSALRREIGNRNAPVAQE
jgi:hypothetical protein